MFFFLYLSLSLLLLRQQHIAFLFPPSDFGNFCQTAVTYQACVRKGILSDSGSGGDPLDISPIRYQPKKNNVLTHIEEYERCRPWLVFFSSKSEKDGAAECKTCRT